MSNLIKMYDGCDYAGMLEHAAEASREWPLFLRTAIARNVSSEPTIQWAKGLGPNGPEVDELSAILTKLANGAVARKGVAHGDGIRFIAQAVARAFPNMVQRCTGVDTSATPKALKDGEKAILATRPDGEKTRTIGFKVILKGEKADIADDTEIVPGVYTPQEHLETRAVMPEKPMVNPFTDHDKAIRHDGETSGYARGLMIGKAQADKAQADKAQARAYALVRESVLTMLAMLAMMPDSIGNHAWACSSDERPAVRKAQARKAQAR